MAETNLPVTPGSGTNVAGYTDASSNFQQLIMLGDSGASFANVLAGDSGQNTLLVAGNRKETSFSLNSNTSITGIDTSNYRWVSVHITAQGGSAQVNFEGSNDNSNWVAISMLSASAIGSSSATTGSTASGVIFQGPVPTRYFRIRVSGLVSGASTGIIELFAVPPAIVSGFTTLPGGQQGSADGLNNPTTASIWGYGLRYNGSTFDRERGNIDTAALVTASAATTTQTGADQTNHNSRGVKVVLDMTSVGTGSVTLEIDGKDGASGKYYAILTGVAVITNSTNVYTIYPGATVAANVSASDVIPRTWRVKVTANNANATTYTVGASLIN